MAADPRVFIDVALVVVAAMLGAVVARAAGQPLILGYVLGGIVVGPFTPGPVVSDIHTFEVFAEIGVVLLMFSIGMEFSLRDLLRVKWVALVGGPLGILLSVAAGAAVWWLLGWPLVAGVIVGMVVSVASTMVLARLLMDRGELRSAHGRVMIGITLVEDLAVVVLTVLVPVLGALEPGRLLAVASALGRAALVLAPFAYVAARVMPPLMRRVARTQSDELFLMVALAIGIGTAALTQAVGLSVALGAFLGGLLISASDYGHETLERLLPLRDVFVAIFFVTVGTLIDPATVFANLPLLAVMLALIVVGKLVIWTGVVWLMRYPLATALRVGIGLTQIGEFSFILVQVARASGHVGADIYNATLAASLLTILLNAALVRYARSWIAAALGTREPTAPAAAGTGTLRDHVLLCGFGRVGSAVGEALETFGIPFAVLERDANIATALRRRGVSCYSGDAADRARLAAAGAERAALVIVALPDIEPALRAVHAIRTVAAHVPILARAHGAAEAAGLREAGATEVIQPEVEASAALIQHALAALAQPGDVATAYRERFRAAMQTADGDAARPAATLPEVREIRIGAGLADQSLREAGIRERYGVTVVAVARTDGVILNPPAGTTLRVGDTVRVFGLPDQVRAFAAASAADA